MDGLIMRPLPLIRDPLRRAERVFGDRRVTSRTAEDDHCHTCTEHPAVARARVVAVPDEKWLERPPACVVTRSPATAAELSDHVHRTGTALGTEAG